MTAAIHPEYIPFILNIFMWLTPLFLILIISLYIMWCLHILMKNKPKKNLRPKRALTNDTLKGEKRLSMFQKFMEKMAKFKLSAQMKFSIIIFSYWFQWTPPCIVSITNSICNNCIDGTATSSIYWLTFSVCVVDPLVVLLLNTNVSLGCFSKKKNSKK